MVEDEIGTSEGIPQQVGVEAPFRITALARGLDADDRQRGLQAADNRRNAAPLVSRPGGEGLRRNVSVERNEEPGPQRTHELRKRDIETAIVRRRSKIIRHRLHDLLVEAHRLVECLRRHRLRRLRRQIAHGIGQRHSSGLPRAELTGIALERCHDRLRTAIAVRALHDHVSFPRRVTRSVHQHRRRQQRRQIVAGHDEPFVVAWRKGVRPRGDRERTVVAKQHRRGRRTEVGQRDERPAIVTNGESGKIPTRRRQCRFAEIAMDDAQLRSAFEEHAFPDFCALQHRRRILGQVGLDDERREMSGRCLWLQATNVDGFFQRPIYRQFDRNIPVSGTARARVPTPVIGVNREREDIGGTH